MLLQLLHQAQHDHYQPVFFILTHLCDFEQEELFALSDEVDHGLELAAQHYSTQILRKLARPGERDCERSTALLEETDYHTVDINHLEAFKPRSIGVETLAFFAFMQLRLGEKLTELGFSGL